MAAFADEAHILTIAVLGFQHERRVFYFKQLLNMTFDSLVIYLLNFLRSQVYLVLLRRVHFDNTSEFGTQFSFKFFYYLLTGYQKYSVRKLEFVNQGQLD